MSAGRKRWGLWSRKLSGALFVSGAFASALGGSWTGKASAETGTAATSQPDYLTPVALKFSPDGGKLYVVCEEDDSLLVVDVRTQRVIGKAKVGHKPGDVAVSPDGKTLYVSNEWSDTVTELDAASLQARRTLPTGWGPIGLTTDRRGRFLYVANSVGNDVSLLDLQRGV